MKILKGLLILAVLMAPSCKRDHKLSRVLKINHYPSASGIEFFNKKFYVIGDDAKYMLILDTNLNAIDSVLLYTYDGIRIPKDSKPDLESAGIISYNNKPMLFLPGSGSLPNRNTGWLIDPLTLQKDSLKLDTFFNLLKLKGLDEINIEGFCSLPGRIIFSNRGHKAWPHNSLIITDNTFSQNQFRAPAYIARLGNKSDSTNFQGVSGLAYASGSDRLILSVSTEDTRSSYEDGAIGKSYLWIIENISSKLRWEGINPNKIIDLENTDSRFKGQKIESMCITKESKGSITLVLVADNDDGSSTLFELILKK